MSGRYFRRAPGAIGLAVHQRLVEGRARVFQRSDVGFSPPGPVPPASLIGSKYSAYRLPGRLGRDVCIGELGS